MKAKLLFLLLGLFSLSVIGQVVPNKDYVTILPPPNSTKETFDNEPTALDLTNNAVFISGYIKTGFTGRDYVLAKFDLNGNVLWSKLYDFAGLEDRAFAVAVDNAGNSYITGASTNSTTTTDIATLKYDINGNLIWTARYNGTANMDDKAFSIALDNAGNVYVSGYATNTGTGKDFTVVKYNSSGVQQFVYTKNGSASGDDVANSLVFFGNKLYVTGNLKNTGTNNDIYTTSLNANSAFVNWNKTQNGTANLNDQSLEVKILGNDVLICGGVTNLGTNQDYFFAKYNASNGSTVFAKTYDAFGGNDFATSIAIDASNTYAIVGVVQNGVNYEYHTAKYNNSGAFTWVNQYKTNTNVISIVPKIAVDPIANHFYVSGLTLNTTIDGSLYQITPSGNQTWSDYYDGVLSKDDAHIDLSVDNLGRIYLASLNGKGGGVYDIALIRYSQTPVYFAPDLATNEKPNPAHLFYENKGQILYENTQTIANEVLFMSEMYPFSYYSIDRINYKFVKHKKDTIIGLSDTVQRVQIQMLDANKLSKAYPFENNQGTLSFMQAGMPDAVLGVKGYNRYFIPNIYPNIDLQYYSNQNGLKMYYIIKPGGSPNSINWQIKGSTSDSIVGNNLEIKGFNGKVSFDKPTVYTINFLGQAQAIPATANWQSVGTGLYKINVSAYNTASPLIIELDYGNTIVSSPSSINNLLYCTYYGGWWDEGIKSVDTDKNTGDYVTLAEVATSAASLKFPIIPGQLVSITTQTNLVGFYIAIMLFDKDGNRKAVNTYGVPGFAMDPMGVTLHGNLVTVVGNIPYYPNPLPLYNSVGPLTSNSYTNASGPGYAIQFEYVPTTGGVGSINKIKWRTYLNGYASDIAKTPDGKDLYITSATDNSLYTTDTKPKTGAYNSSTFGIFGLPHFQISKFDSVGFRKWSTIWQAINTVYQNGAGFNFLNNNAGLSMKYDQYTKCKIACDNYGFSIAGATDTVGLFTFSRYGTPLNNTFSGRSDAFFARFNKQDSLVYSTYIGGNQDEGYLDIASSGKKESVMVGYCNSPNMQKITTNPNLIEYNDSTITTNNAKILVTKFDTIGNKTWSTFFGSNFSFKNVFGMSVATDNLGKTFVTGRDLGSFAFPTLNPTGLYTNYGINNTESYMLCFTNTNQVIWNTRFGGAYEDVSTSLAFNPINNSIILTGLTNSNHNFFPNFPITQSPIPTAYFQQYLNSYSGVQTAYDGFIAVFSTNSIIGIEEYFKDKVSVDAFNLFPNPSQNQTFIAFKNEMKGDVKIIIYNQLGQVIETISNRDVSAHSILPLNTQNLPNGMYLVAVNNDNITQIKKLIVSK